MIVNGKTIKADENGVVKFKTQINNKKGNYKIPFIIEFTKPDGHIRREKKEVEYTVEE